MAEMNNPYNPPPVDVEAEIFNVMVARYISAIGMITLLYDCVITMDEEVRHSCLSRFIRSLVKVRLIWRGALTFPKLLYYINRYFTLALSLYCTYSQCGFSFMRVE
jgi:Family of unknown function (DUF6533)